MHARLTTCVMLTALAIALPARAEVSVGELLRTCRAALHDRYEGVDAAMCDWWIRPCGVCGLEPKSVEWCIPQTMQDAEVAARIVKELEAAPALAPVSARKVVAKLLAANYPCADQRPPSR